jgi:dolichyl-phosphate beta-glucosyltransferase
MAAAVPRLSVVIPAYNEAQRLPATLERLAAWFAAFKGRAELIVVDDGSTDGTAAVAEAWSPRMPPNAVLRVVRHDTNRGKGAAIRDGCLRAAGEVVLFTDADLASPPEEWPKVLAAIDEGAGVAIGSRLHPDGSDRRDSQPLARRLAGRLYTFVRRLIVLRDVADTQCPLKAFRREAARAIFERQRLAGWVFDAEVILLARRLGYRVAVVPVEWRHQPGSRVRLRLPQAVAVLRDLIRLRSMHRDVDPGEAASGAAA